MTEEMAGNEGIDNGRKKSSYGSIKPSSQMTIRSPPNLKLMNSGTHGYTRIVESEERPPHLLGIRGSWLFVMYVTFYIFYLVSGGLMFSALEAPMENQVRQQLLRSRNEFLRRFPEVNEEALEELIEEVVRAGNRGVSASRNASGEPNWSFGQSIFFSSTVVTTIGYGHVTPLSRAGKVFCMAYAACGIPLTLVLLAALVERLLWPASALLRALNHRLGHLYQPFSIRLLHLFIIVAMLIIFFLAIPASVFSVLEPEWDYLDSLYYCFISLTTIGLGDYIPGDTPNQPMRPLYKVATTVYLLVGLTFMMLTLTVYYDIPQLNVGLIFSSQESQCAYDPEKMRLSDGSMVGPQYTVGSLTIPGQYAPQCDDPTASTRRSVVRVKPHRDDSPSPEDTTPVHARDLRVP